LLRRIKTPSARAARLRRAFTILKAKRGDFERGWPESETFGVRKGKREKGRGKRKAENAEEPEVAEVSRRKDERSGRDV